MTSAV